MIFLLFDGLDEINTSCLDSFIRYFNAFLDRYSNNTFIITSRPYSNSQYLSRFVRLRLEPFDKQRALDLIDRFNYRSDIPGFQRRFRSLFNNTLYATHRGFSDNPLLLSIMMLTFEMDADVPTVKYLFYQEAYTALSKRHDAAKDGYKRQFLTGWNANKFSDYFSYFCARTYCDEVTSFEYPKLEQYFNDLIRKYNLENITVDDFIYDATNNLCLMYFDAPFYGFIHRSFQEYFCAKFFSNQMDEDLRRVIPVFDRDGRNKKDDSALPMLYDMKPRAVEKYMIIPYLEQLIHECESGSGIWRFLEKLYPDYQAADGDAEPDNSSCKPASELYSFILDHYDVALNSFDPEKIDDIEDLIVDTMYYREDTGEDVWSDDIPYNYEDFYGEALVTGHLYIFDWKEIQSDPDRYQGVISFVMDPDKPFMAEYLEIKKLLERLKKKIDDNPDTEDIFDRMF